MVGSAIFLDRDGVLIADEGPLCQAENIRVLPGVVEALSLLKDEGHRLFVVTNQTVVSRGLLTEREMLELQHQIEVQIATGTSSPLDGFYYCPHHPSATDERYRQSCRCRKPAPGLLERAAEQHGLDLKSSWMIGDRPSDVSAGHAAGCRTIQVRCGRHEDAPIEVLGGFTPPSPHLICEDLLEAAKWIADARAQRQSRVPEGARRSSEGHP
ncbi:MAG: HAD family hydrolase [Myxococcota bacterium]